MDDALDTTTTDLGSLAQYVAENTVPLRQYPDKVILKLDLLEKDEITTKTLEIPPPFKDSFFCQAFIAYCYTDYFGALGDTTKNGLRAGYQRFFNFLIERDEKCAEDESWAELVSAAGDLPYDVIHQFLLSLSHQGTGATSLSSYQLNLNKPITWAAQIDIISETSSYNLLGGAQLLPYLARKNNPEIKPDDKQAKPALSQLFTMDYATGEAIDCPYLDTQLISSLRWFAVWYLDLMRQRRAFMQTVRWDEHSTIYEVLIERLKSGQWTLDSKPVSQMYGKYSKADKDVPLPVFVEASAMYAKIFQTLLSATQETEQLNNGSLTTALQNRLLWLEPLGFSQGEAKTVFEDMITYHSDADSIIGRMSNLLTCNTSYALRSGRNQPRVALPVVLGTSSKKIREVIASPGFSLADMLIPTLSEQQVMSWLLASDSLQWSNQLRLNLADLKPSDDGKLFQILHAVDTDGVKIRHHKRRGKGAKAEGAGKDHNTITYQKGDPLFATYSNWFEDVSAAQPYLTKSQGKWFTQFSSIKNNGMSSLWPLSFLCAQDSLLRSAYEKAERELKYHSDLNGQGAFQWLLTALICHHAAYRKKRKNSSVVPLIILGSDAIRQSRIIFNEGHSESDAVNAKETAHGEQQVRQYRERGNAKERILNGIKSNAQVADLMAEESISILDYCHIMSVEEVQRTLHDPSGFTVDDVITFINEIANDPGHYDVTIFGGIKDKADQSSGIKIINDEKSAWMLWCYIQHIESELEEIEVNHGERAVKWTFEHAQWSILFERFPAETQQQAKDLAAQYSVPYPPLF